jgi:hypothetical protein
MLRAMGAFPLELRSVWTAIVLLALCAGCRDEQAGPRGRGVRLPPPAQARTLDAAPGDLTFRSGATWGGGAVVYLGSRVTPARAIPGQPVTVAHYFQARQPPPQGYQFFVHLVDPATGQQLANLDHEIQGGAMPLGSWPVGKVIEDVQGVPTSPNFAKLQLRLGFWRGDQRLKVDDPAAQDGSERMLGPTIELQDGAPLPEYHVKKTPRPPVIDGVPSDPVWAQASEVTLGNSFDGHRPALRTTARLLYDDANLYVAFDCEDPDVWGTLLKRDDPIYNEEVVEIFLDANADGRTYNELEVSPHNTVFDAYFPARRQGQDNAWDSGMKSAVKVRGTIDNPSDRDEGWSVELQIPIARLAEVPHVPPRPGDRWRFNLYRLEHLDRKQVEGQAFSPLYQGDFHNLPRFGWLVFE